MWAIHLSEDPLLGQRKSLQTGRHGSPMYVLRLCRCWRLLEARRIRPPILTGVYDRWPNSATRQTGLPSPIPTLSDIPHSFIRLSTFKLEFIPRKGQTSKENNKSTMSINSSHLTKIIMHWRLLVSTSDIIYLLIGLGRIALAILTIYATIMARAGNDFPVENIEMQSLS